MTIQQRLSPRHATNVVLDCLVGRQRAQAILCDVSPSGCRVELFDASAEPGAMLIFEIDDRLAFAGQVVWVQGAEAGVQFTRPLLPQILAALDVKPS
ncbi:PilZ domain-containing protein [Qipengyuania gaetbuli]|uniref:PilZ domain-containing protein n=1 Tax=Qipengyuania gaetbuli TaxID=266952 RepID=UPI001CD299AF|nr:PilZ domain-containing protein [Qipengyuania gaetbuli]MCA0909731.1 PilZ domain-containing protein [Qipengyuania gaetbuli]